MYVASLDFIGNPFGLELIAGIERPPFPVVGKDAAVALDGILVGRYLQARQS
ncbi:MAG: hypothetical protein QF541_03835 [Lentisphaeria bacterium]|jgi:hypothetical protein|nr:hypothetical protein [Lentisphaeria bacterium]